MAEKVGGIYYEVDAKTDALLKAVGDVEKASKKMEGSLGDADKATKDLSGSMGKMNPVAAAVSRHFRGVSIDGAKMAATIKAASMAIAAATGVAAGLAAGIYALTVNTMAAIDEQQKFADRVGGSIGAIRALELAAGDAGASTESMRSAIDRLNMSLSQAERGSGTAGDALKSLGLNARDLIAMDADERMAVLADRIRELGLDTAQTADLMQQLGIRNRDLIGLMRAGGDAIRGARDEVRDFGLELDRVDVAQIEMANDALSRIGTMIQVIRERVAVALAPYLLIAAERFNQMAREAGGWGDVAGKAIDAILQNGARVLDWFMDMQEAQVRWRLGMAEMENSVTQFTRHTNDRLYTTFDLWISSLNLVISAYNRLPTFGAKIEPVVTIQERLAEAADTSAAKVQDLSDRLDRLQGRERPSAIIARMLEDVRQRAEEMVEGMDGARESTFSFNDALEEAVSTGGATVDTMDRLRGAYGRLLDQLFPAEAAQRKFLDDQYLLKLALSDGAITIDEYADAIQRLRQAFIGEDGEGPMGDDPAGYWVKWIDAASDALGNFDALATSVIDNFTAGFGRAFEDMIFDAKDANDAFRGLAETILRSVVRSLGQMAAQWIAFKMVQIATGKQAEAAAVAGAATTGPAIASAYAPAAASVSLATMGANAAPAMAGISATHAASKAMALTGMAHDGLDYVPKEGTWLLDKGERVVGASLNQDLGQFLEREKADRTSPGRGSGVSININLVESAERAGQVIERPANDEGTQTIDIFVADIMSDGPASTALRNKFGLSPRGR